MKIIYEFSPQRREERKEILMRTKKPEISLRSLMRAIPGAPPAGALRASNFVPDKIVRLCGR
jgi:hypothetical protein